MVEDLGAPLSGVPYSRPRCTQVFPLPEPLSSWCVPQDEDEQDTSYEASRSPFLLRKRVRGRKEAIMTIQETQPREIVGAARASSEPRSWSSDQGLFRKEGEYWTLGYAGHLCRLKDPRGLEHL